MAYTKSNEIMTRISLKYDSYENWTSKNPVLLKGEVAIATIAKPQNGEHATGFQNLPNVVMKVGDGSSHYNDLKFVSGLAADVYDWAKAANKPSYALSEIANAVEYQLVAIDATAYKYQLQSRKAGSSDAWAKVSDLDLSGIDGRLDALESDLNTAKTGLKARMGAAEVRLDAIDGENGRLAKLESAVGSNGAVSGMITDAIAALDTTKTQTAGDDGLALEIVQTDGVITKISGSIAPGTYDESGAAEGVKTALLNGEIKSNADAIKIINGNDTGKSMREVANAAIGALDITKDQTAGADGLALHIKEENGVITEFSGSIKANTYDAYGAAKAVRGGDDNYKETVKSAYDRADAAYALADNAQTAGEVADAITAQVATLKFTGVEGTQSGATIKFVDKISQANGIVSAELGELKLQSAYVPEAGETQNLIATMKDVTAAVADLNGAMHFEGVYDEIPSVNHDGEAFKAGDVIIVGKTEYVFSGGKFVELGDEGAIAAALATLSQTEVGAADKTLKVKQENGKVTATEVAIQIAESQVTGLEEDLADLGKEDLRLAGLIKDNTDAIDVIVGDVDGDDAKSMRTIAQEEALKAVDIDVADIAIGADSTLTVIGQTDGSIHATATKIQIAQNQVTGLPNALNNKLESSVYNDFKKDEFTPVKNSVDTLKGDASKAGSVAHSINTAVANLKNTDAAVDGQYVKAVKQSNGIVTVERAALPVLAITHDSSVEEPTATEVTVVKDIIDHNGFTITDTHVKVATKAGVNAAIAALSTTVAPEDKKVLTSLTQTNGVVSATKATLADIAFSGKVDDLKQDTNTYIVFNCGSAEINI